MKVVNHVTGVQCAECRSDAPSSEARVACALSCDLGGEPSSGATDRSSPLNTNGDAACILTDKWNLQTMLVGLTVPSGATMRHLEHQLIAT